MMREPRPRKFDHSYTRLMTGRAFEIQITRQGWIDPELDDSPFDLCSHGDIRLEIGGEVISTGDDGDYTISTSALALLRTLESDHSPERPVADRLILHCGMIEMLTCPIGIDWCVAHREGHVRLYDVRRFDTVDGVLPFAGIDVEVPERDYRRQIAAFAGTAKVPFANTVKTPADDYEQRVYDDFWHEYEGRLRRAQ
jgi:hypothetical protein